MRVSRAIFVFIVLIAASALSAQVSNAAPGEAPHAPSNVDSQSLRILSPQNGQKIRDNYVDVRFELTNPGATVNTPTFVVQLDSRDPVQTTSSDQSFSGLKPGTHTVSVELVDANGTPIVGSRAQVQFIVAPQQPTAVPPAAPKLADGSGVPRLQNIAFDQSASTQKGNAQQKSEDADDSLPHSGSALPLLSLIGFGVLVGGITSALKTR
jgi:hypothetical protein